MLTMNSAISLYLCLLSKKMFLNRYRIQVVIYVFLLLVSKIECKSQFFLWRKWKGNGILFYAINFPWKEFCLPGEKKNTSNLVVHCSFLINYVYTHDEENLISANYKQDKAIADWYSWLFLAISPAVAL